MESVIVYFLHEDEQSFANDHLNEAQNTESFVMGLASKADIKAMRKRGLMVQELDRKTEEVGLKKIKWKHKTYRSREIGEGPEDLQPLSESVDFGMRPPSGDTADIDLTGDNYYTIELKGPLMEPWRNELERIGLQIMENEGGFNFKAKGDLGIMAELNDLDFVSRTSVIGVDDTNVISTTPLGTGGQPEFGKKTLKFDVILHEPEGSEKILEWLQSNNIGIEGSSRNKIRIFLPQGSPNINRIKALKEVSRIEEFIEPKLFNDIARMILSMDRQGSTAVNSLKFQGEGETVGVADTGIDDTHKDFRNRILHKIALGRLNDYSDFHGHGTHVAGSVLGDGSDSGGKYKGTAPKAKLVFQSLMDGNGRLTGLPIHLGDLFDQAYRLGVRIHNNSWGAATNSRYTINSVEVDEYVDQNRDMLIVFAAGNEGSSKNNLNADVGFVDWLSIGSPASSKNALTVGASRSSRTSGGISTLTYGQAWPNDFPDPPISNEKISGKATSIAGYSSRGPCDDGRIKPDVVAPGTDIISTKSSTAPIGNFDGSVRSTNKYAYMGGTSMACPLVSGCAAVVREFYRKKKDYDTPSAALVKATLINGTKVLKSQDAMTPYNITPNFQQGFGRVDMVNTIPNAQNRDLKLSYVDKWQDSGRAFNATGQRRRYTIRAGSGLELRVCMAYTDLPGRALQNNLNLVVEYDDGNGNRVKLFGNQDFIGTPGNFNMPDTKNNVECVRIRNPKAGNFLIQVFAFNLLSGGQDFSLVVTGDLKNDLTEI